MKLRDTAYNSLIRPALEYSCSVWHPHKKSNKDKIEKVQRRAARFVSNNFRRKASVSEMLHNLGWQSLDSRRQDQRLVLFYKIINGLASVETEVHPHASRLPYKEESQLQIQTPPGKL